MRVSARLFPMVSLAMASTLAACREATGPWEIAGTSPDSAGAMRITFSSANEMYPTWSPDGRSILYAAESFAGLPPGAGLLLAIDRSGGTAGLIFPDIQGNGAGGPRRLAVPEEAPAGSDVAYFDLVRINQPATVITPTGCTLPEPVLDSVLVRIRKRGETRSILQDPAVSLRLAGPDPDQREGGAGPFTVRVHPFQWLFFETGTVSLRASWSPDGRLVYSDGLRLLVRAADGITIEVPGTADAVMPAWSPDGEWIAFTRLERGDSTTQVCDIAVGNIVIRQFRVGYAGGPSTIVQVRPDGSEALELAVGESPAWSPDGSSIYFAASGGIFRVSRGGGAPEPIPQTEYGYWPAVAPDGGRLAFMRRGVAWTWDLWTVPLAH